MGGGGGSYAGYTIPAKMAINENGKYTCSTKPNLIEVTAISVANPKNMIRVSFGSDGRMTDWKYLW